MTARRPVIAVLIAATCAPVALVPRSPAVDPGYNEEINKRITEWNAKPALRPFATVPPPAAAADAATAPTPTGRGTVRMLCFAVNELNLQSEGYRGVTADPLRSPTRDAAAYMQAGTRLGYTAQQFTNEGATADRLLGEIDKASRACKSGDTLIVTFAGHGSQMRDLNGDENGGKDSTWCLFDRMVIDDELGEAWTKFEAGVKIVVIADSCHSGTSARALGRAKNVGQQENSRGARALANGGVAVDAGGVEVRVRTLRADAAQTASDNHARASFRDKFTAVRGNGESDQMTRATVLLLAGCQDEQTSAEDSEHGYFTRALLNTAGDGRYSGTYLELQGAVAQKIRDSNQTPKVTAFGAGSQDFLNSKPFSN